MEQGKEKRVKPEVVPLNVNLHVSFTALPLTAGEMLLKLELQHLSGRKGVVIEKIASGHISPRLLVVAWKQRKHFKRIIATH